MTSQIFGWTGKILKIDLTNLTTSEINTMNYADRFLGGRGIATRIYWEEVTPETGAFDPDNRLIFMTGPLAGTGVQGAARFVVAGKSPMLLPEGFCYGNLGGFFAPYLKKAGFDGIVISGRAEKPCYILINNNETEIKDASHIWGKSVYEVKDIIINTYGRQAHYITTGISGENLCRNAALMTDHEGAATGGFGAVLGSKNLKAIAVIGSGKISAARPQELTDLNRLTIKMSERATLRMPLPKKQVQFVKKASCYQCGIDCLRGVFRTASGKEAIRKCQSLAFYMPFVAGRENESMETAIDATGICNNYSICTMEMHNIITWLRACYKAGALNDEQTGIRFSDLGSRNFIETLAAMIARRQGFGDILAEGILRAAEKLGDRAKSLIPDNVDGASGIGIGTGYAPREYVVNTLLYAFEPRQPLAMLHEVSFLIAHWLLHMIRPELSPTTARVFRDAAVKFWGHEKAWDMTSYEGKAAASVKIQDRSYVKDSLVLCDYVWPIMDSFNTPDNVGDPALESRIFSAVTGIDKNESELNLFGERIFNLQRAVLLREGWKPEKNDSPAEFNFIKPLANDIDNPTVNPNHFVPGPDEDPVCLKGNVLDREKFEVMRKEFYQLRGWDVETGLQKKTALERMGLSDVAQVLEKKGLIAE
ncbi:MAG: hypothetical protein MUC95_09280 [Spirochaetes bacterium]|nr:hypothetical protein [Spirochaetota bacterium]